MPLPASRKRSSTMSNIFWKTKLAAPWTLRLKPGPRTDTGRLERYWAARQQLRQDDLPALCRESGMGAQQVLNWFYSRSPEPAEVVVCLGEEPEDEDEEAGLMVQDDGEEEDDEPEEEDLGAQE
ncbi:Homeobox and leucine zipper protein Homez [Chelonia mydas]|uniref:Homeobox and leucine zipper protein Homez n=1 Tax=Chelonia mydas TaxID=8469 RepID=M7BR34_CHEMY|nr:Homeobox and leucine zipper protein Homez [Chelonia mydas]